MICFFSKVFCAFTGQGNNKNELLPTDVRAKRFELLLEEIERDGDVDRMADDFVVGFAMHGDLYPGALELLEELSQRVSLGLITNGLSEVQRPRIDRLGIEHYLDAIVVSAEVGVTKPGSAIFDIAFERLGHPPKDEVLMVGDSLSSDIKGGANYGVDTCWYNPNGKTSGPADRITYEITRIDELPALLDGQGPFSPGGRVGQ